MNFIKNWRVYDVMPRAFFSDSFNELKCGQAEEKLEAGGDEKLIFNFIWPNFTNFTNVTLVAAVAVTLIL